MLGGWHGGAPQRAEVTSMGRLRGGGGGGAQLKLLLGHSLLQQDGGIHKRIDPVLAGCSSVCSSFAQRSATASHSAAYAARLWKRLSFAPPRISPQGRPSLGSMASSTSGFPISARCSCAIVTYSMITHGAYVRSLHTIYSWWPST
jgi:hypothetical protein